MFKQVFGFVLSSTLICSIALHATPVFAQATGSFFVAAKRLDNGKFSTPLAGKGKVTVKVFVRADGTPDAKQTTVVKSENPGNNAAALEVASSAKYKPAARDGKPTGSFYTFTINFSATGTDELSDGTSNGTLTKIAAMERANNFSGAKTELQAYLATAPDDKKANELLGIADAFSGDALGAANAFDKSGPIGPQYRNVAMKAYIDAASAGVKSGTFDLAVSQATKAIDDGAGSEAYNVRGSALYGLKKYDAAVVDLEKARDLAIAAKSAPRQIAIVETNLASAYLAAGQVDKGLATAKDVTRLDPAQTAAQDAVATYYSTKGQAATTAGDRAAAVTLYETGATAAPKYAITFYTSAANVLAGDVKPDWKLVKAEADKALAVDPGDARANFLSGIALANSGNTKDALVALMKAQTAAKNGSDTRLATAIDDAIKKLTPSK